ncbi:hypothetical protein LSTR_LSTR007753, partial [Laodelphax striatellus]
TNLSLKMSCEEDCCEDISFQGVWDWIIKFNDPFLLHKAQPTYLYSQASFIFGAAATLYHALKNGGRWPYLWFGTVLHGLVLEIICYIQPNVDNFWHSQTPIILLGRRLPLHIVFLYPCFIYQAMAAVANMRLSRWAEQWAVGATVVLIDMPYDIASVKFLHWTWHDTDPNIGDRHYWVPWNSYFFHCTFAASFIFWFNRSNGLGEINDKWSAKSFLIEVRRMLVASLLGAPGGVLVFILIYHPLHDIAGIHSEVTFFMMFSIVLLIVWSSDRSSNKSSITPAFRSRAILLTALLVHYSVFLLMVMFGKPEDEQSTGLHEPTGPCHETSPLQTALGMVLQKKKYLCVDDYEEGYFDFSCVPSGPPEGIKRWYTICGTAFQNRTEYVSIIATISIVAAGFFYNTHFKNVNQASKDLEIKKST